jgi:maleate isomerase
LQSPKYNTKYRLGIIVPSLNVTIEPEFNAVAPEDVSIHATRLLLRRGTRKDLIDMANATEYACRMLDSADVGAVLYACTTGSMIGGKKWEKKLEQRMKGATSVPVITTAGAVLQALDTLGLRRIAVGTPYSKELNDAEVQFLEENGFEVTKIKGLGYTKGGPLHAEPQETTVKLARAVDSPEAEGIFLSCTDLKTMTVIQRIEEELGKPVVTSNAASLWRSLKALKRTGSVSGLGILLAKY